MPTSEPATESSSVEPLELGQSTEALPEDPLSIVEQLASDELNGRNNLTDGSTAARRLLVSKLAGVLEPARPDVAGDDRYLQPYDAGTNVVGMINDDDAVELLDPVARAVPDFWLLPADGPEAAAEFLPQLQAIVDAGPRHVTTQRLGWCSPVQQRWSTRWARPSAAAHVISPVCGRGWAGPVALRSASLDIGVAKAHQGRRRRGRMRTVRRAA
jgi:hypothetical protein